MFRPDVAEGEPHSGNRDEGALPWTVKTSSLTTVLWTATLAVFSVCCVRQLVVFARGMQEFRGYLPLFDLDGESNLPAWYSSVLMWTAAGLLVLHANVARRLKRRTAGHWWALAAIFALMSLDETAQIHELGNEILPDSINPGGFFAFRWVIVAAPLLLVVGLAYIPLLRRLPAGSARQITISGLVYVAGAYGVEHLGAYFMATRGAGRLFYATVMLEEGMEMGGLCLFISALLVLLAREAPRVSLDLR